MPAEVIETGLGVTKYVVPAPKIYTATSLIEDEFEEVPYLYLDRLRTDAAPEIDACEFHYVYGPQARPGKATKQVYEPLDIVGQCVKVVIPATVEDDEEIVWYGQIEGCETISHGTQNEDDPLGVQNFVAFGPLRMLEKMIINKSWIHDGAGGTIAIETALPFNYDQGGEFPAVGNMALITVDGDSVPVFSQRQQSSQKWSAAYAIQYLLQRFAPKNSLGLDANPWSVDPDFDLADIASWYEASVDADLQTVKTVLDKFLDRRRGFSYYVTCEPDDDTSQPNKIILHPFSFAKEDVTLPSGATIAANPNQRELDFEKALDVVEAIVGDVAMARFHRVRVYGEHITSTFTTSPFNEPAALTKDWSGTEESAFLAGASEAPDYPATPELRYIRNSIARCCDNLRSVFRRFKLNEEWDGKTLAWHDDVSGNYFVCPLFGEEDAAIVALYDADDNPTGEQLWLQGLQIERHLPLHDRWDYSGTKIEDGTAGGDVDDEETDLGFIPILVYIKTSGTGINVRDSDGEIILGPPRFEQVELLNLTSYDDENGRRWACHVHVRNNYPGVEVHAHPPQMLGLNEWTDGSPATTDPSHDPTQMNGLPWEDLFFTICIKVQKRVQCTKQILPLNIGEPATELAIYVPGARLDYVVPYTTVRVEDGIPIVTTSGGAVRDDRMRVADIARGAAEWYGDDRKTLRLTYKQVRNLFEIGWLITNIGANYSPDGINTPITAIEYRFPGTQAPTTTIETAFAALDFSL